MSTQQQDHPLCMWELISMGYRVHELVTCTEDTVLWSPPSEAAGVINRIDLLLRDLEMLDLQDTDGVADMTLRPLRFRFGKRAAADQHTLGTDAPRLRKVLGELLEKMELEARRRQVYPVRPSKWPKIDRLITEPNLIFDLPDDLDPPLPERMYHYTREAARCLAVGFGTAAANCILVATDVLVNFYYEAILGSPPPRRRRYLGLMVSDLRDSGKCPELVLDCLGHVVSELRNPTLHAKLDIDDAKAIEIWMICREAVREAVKDLIGRGSLRTARSMLD